MEQGGNDAIVAKALKDLIGHWEQSATVWNDGARAEFQRDHLDPLAPSVKMASMAIQKIEELMRQARRDCS